MRRSRDRVFEQFDKAYKFKRVNALSWMLNYVAMTDDPDSSTSIAFISDGLLPPLKDWLLYRYNLSATDIIVETHILTTISGSSTFDGYKVRVTSIVKLMKRHSW